MGVVRTLHRHPVKGFAGVSEPSLRIVTDGDGGGHVLGDRVLGVRHGDAEPADGWGPKSQMVVAMNTPALARLSLTLTDGRLRLARGEELLAEEGLDEAGRTRLAAVLATQPELGLAPDSPHLPLRIVGDGETSVLTDSPRGRVTLHSRASVARLAEVMGSGPIADARFRHNIVIDGVPALAELDWVGREVTIGTQRFTVVKPLTRCLATHANPQTGERDLAILKALTGPLGLAKPVFGVALEPVVAGEIHVGDQVTVR